MPRSASGSVFRPVVVRKVKGRRVSKRSAFYWVSYRDAHGEPKRHVLRLSNGMRVTDKDVARAELERIPRAGKNVVSTAMIFLIYPPHADAAMREPLRQACWEGGATF